MNLPTILTLTRILAIPVLLLVFYLPVTWSNYLSASVFAVAAITDWLDGYLARNLSMKTKFGAFLDPVADKLIVVIALVLIVGEKNIYLLSLPAAVIVGREVVISALREWMAEIGKRARVAVKTVSKVKTLIQMLALLLLLLYRPGFSAIPKYTGAFLLYIAAILTLWTMVMYLRTAWPDLTLSLKNK